MEAHSYQQEGTMNPAPVITVVQQDDLVALRIVGIGNGGKSYRGFSERFENDEELRRRAMRARSALAVLLLADYLEARVITVHGERLLLVCRRDRMMATEADASALFDLTQLPDETAAVLPTVPAFGWRYQPGWMLVRDPKPEDYSTVYMFVRASIQWLDNNRTVSDEAFAVLGMHKAEHGSTLEERIRAACAAS